MLIIRLESTWLLSKKRVASCPIVLFWALESSYAGRFMKFLIACLFIIFSLPPHSNVAASSEDDLSRVSFETIRISIVRGNLDLALQQIKRGAESEQLDELEVNLLQGHFFNALGKPKEAIASFSAIQKAKLSVPANLYVGLATSLLMVGDIAQARLNVSKALLSDPNSTPGLLLDIELSKDGLTPEAVLLAYQEVQVLSAFAEEADLAFARHLIDSGNAQAVELLASMRARRPRNPLLNEYFAQAQFMAGDFEAAFITFSAAQAQYEEVSDDYNARRVDDWLRAYEQKKVKLAKPQIETPRDTAVDKGKATSSDGLKQNPALQIRHSGPEHDSLSKSDRDVSSEIEDANPKGALSFSPTAETEKKFPVLSPKPVPDPIVISDGSKVSTGSGFITNQGKWVITNRHVVENWKTVQVRNGLGELKEAKKITYDKYLDLAIIELSEPYAQEISHNLSDVVDPKVGEAVFVIGFPLAQIFGNQHPVISTGIVSSNFGYMESESQFQVTAKMNPGNSGGPVFNRKGEVIGVAVSKLDKKAVEKASGNMPEDVNFALKGAKILDLANYDGAGRNDRASGNLDAEEIYARKRPAVVVVVTETD